MEKTAKIKGMVCRRCIETVKDIFQSQEFIVSSIKLGEVSYKDTANSSFAQVEQLLQAEGFEILTDKQSLLINKVKDLVESELMSNEGYTKNFAALISGTLNMDYDNISSLFSHTEGIKLEQYIINKRIEKVQELLKFTQLTLTDIAFQLGYSSVHHLSNQFKKVTDMSPSQYRELRLNMENTRV